METREQDPVCGMDVYTSSSKFYVLKEKTYYFCSDNCLNKFKYNPDKCEIPIITSMFSSSYAKNKTLLENIKLLENSVFGVLHVLQNHNY
jgi:YHS domain-containing protein